VLPPRPLPCEPNCAGSELQKLLESTPSFDLVLGEVEVFPVSHVIYVSIAHGQDHLRHLHRTLNRGLAKYQELFPYHPHVTLAQDLGTGEVPGKLECARKRWRESPHDRKVHVDMLSFVQYQDGRWVDLQDIRLGASPAPRALKPLPDHSAQPAV
jgi:2'-5' RNA ligase